MTKKEFKELTKVKTKANLKKIGFMQWDEKKPILMLIPANLFNAIPKGTKVTTIGRKNIIFDPKTADDDHRFGALSYGFLVK